MARARLILRVAALAAAISPFAVAQTAAPRAEMPIREVVLSYGVRRYTIPIKVGAVAIDAGLDTTSTGLRIMPYVLSDTDTKATGPQTATAMARAPSWRA